MMDDKFQEEIENEKSSQENTEAQQDTMVFKVTIPEDEPSAVAEEAPVKEEKPQVKAKPQVVAKPVQKAKPAVKKTAEKPVRRKKPAVSQQQIKSERKAKNLVMILSCLMAVVTIATCMVGSFTGVFKDSGVKAVAVLILPQEDKAELEKHLSKLWPLANHGFNTEKMSGEELFSYIRPYSEDGLYTSFGYSATAVTHTADPAGRFADENGNYCYYKIPRAQIDGILSHFGMEENHALNSKNAYYYDSHYYFSSSDDGTEERISGNVTITDSKRIQDGRYYVTCNFGEKEVYVIASMTDTAQGKIWEIHSMSLEPVFDSLGIMIKKENEVAGDYEMRQTVIEGKAEDGTVFRKYVIKYPYFFGETQGEIQANSFYSSVITFYQQQAEQVKTDYKRFLRKGGKTDSLPLETHYVAQLSFMDEKHLSLINEITESVAMYKDTDAEGTAVTLATKTVECNTFEMETGLYASKDSLVGKDYITLSEILYRIYLGYPYEALLDSTVSDVDVPDDYYKLGDKIYESPVAVTKDGYVFCYIDSDGLRQDVRVATETVEKLKVTEE